MRYFLLAHLALSIAYAADTNLSLQPSKENVPKLIQELRTSVSNLPFTLEPHPEIMTLLCAICPQILELSDEEFNDAVGLQVSKADRDSARLTCQQFVNCESAFMHMGLFQFLFALHENEPASFNDFILLCGHQLYDWFIVQCFLNPDAIPANTMHGSIQSNMHDLILAKGIYEKLAAKDLVNIQLALFNQSHLDFILTAYNCYLNGVSLSANGSTSMSEDPLMYYQSGLDLFVLFLNAFPGRASQMVIQAFHSSDMPCSDFEACLLRACPGSPINFYVSYIKSGMTPLRSLESLDSEKLEQIRSKLPDGLRKVLDY